MIERDYFTVEETSATIPSRGALAIFAGDKPRKNADGSTSHSLRGPLLLMPQEMWSDADETMAKIAKLLNDNAHLFFDSAKAKEPAPGPRDVLAEAEEMADMLLKQHDAFSGHAADTIRSLIALATAQAARIEGLEAERDRRTEMHECAMSERDDATLYADEQKARAEAAEIALAAITKERDEALHFLDVSIAKSPEPLKALGSYLADLLDEDDWPTADRLLNGAVVALAAREPWQPIATVPMDGSRVDLWSLEGHRICGCNPAVYDLTKFSHWMPAPKPPALIDKGAA